MRILVYCINFFPELVSTGKYTGEMATWLAADGHEVRAITANPYYPDWKVWKEFPNWKYSSRTVGEVQVTHCPLYVPARPTALKRILHFISFSFTSSWAVLAQWRWRPELIIFVAPTMMCAPQVILLKHLTGAKAVMHVQDFEVDLLFGLNFFKSVFTRRLLLTIEGFLLRRFDRISTISQGMLERARKKGVRESQLRFFPNWSDVQRFSHAKRSAELLTQLGLDPLKPLVLYSGNMGEKQGLDLVVEAAARMALSSNAQFLFVGNGADKDRLIGLVREKRLANVGFADLLPNETFPTLLASADCHLVVQKRGAADVVLPSKLTNILAAGGNAVITADAHTTLGELCARHPGIAVLSEPESVEALVAGILIALKNPCPNQVAVKYAKAFLDKDQILVRFFAEL